MTNSVIAILLWTITTNWSHAEFNPVATFMDERHWRKADKYYTETGMVYSNYVVRCEVNMNTNDVLIGRIPIQRIVRTFNYDTSENATSKTNQINILQWSHGFNEGDAFQYIPTTY